MKKLLILIIGTILLLTACGGDDNEGEIIRNQKAQEEKQGEKERHPEAKDVKFLDETGKELLNSNHIESVSTGRDENGAYIHLELTDEGQELFYKATSENIGKAISITVDDVIISAPTVQEAINDDECIIQGDFTYEQAIEFAQAISFGLPSYEYGIPTDEYNEE